LTHFFRFFNFFFVEKKMPKDNYKIQTQEEGFVQILLGVFIHLSMLDVIALIWISMVTYITFAFWHTRNFSVLFFSGNVKRVPFEFSYLLLFFWYFQDYLQVTWYLFVWPLIDVTDFFSLDWICTNEFMFIFTFIFHFQTFLYLSFILYPFITFSPLFNLDFWITNPFFFFVKSKLEKQSRIRFQKFSLLSSSIVFLLLKNKFF
jgi:hypothetical protein